MEDDKDEVEPDLRGDGAGDGPREEPPTCVVLRSCAREEIVDEAEGLDADQAPSKARIPEAAGEVRGVVLEGEAEEVAGVVARGV